MAGVTLASDARFVFFNDTATTEIYTLSLHDALPIWRRRGVDPAARAAAGDVRRSGDRPRPARQAVRRARSVRHLRQDRKSTRLNSSHANISYAVFCLKKKTINHYLCTDFLLDNHFVI